MPMSNDDSAWDDPTVVEWARHVVDDLAPMVAQSDVCVSLVPLDDGTGDAKLWVETGAMMWLDKPIIVLVIGDRSIPHKMELVADEVVRLPEGVNPQGSDELASAIYRVINRESHDANE